ncbi:unnamed protein product [Calicophoron daubneyi]|uniref:BTB domain-containing protein n=1 Tax=Calicophoron daubneyi TaxID=300641 RepID=A0AAV2TD08_CALDB
MSFNQRSYINTGAGSKLLSKLNEQRLQGDECDLTLSNGECTRSVHRCLFRAISPVIEKHCADCQKTEEGAVYRLVNMSTEVLDLLINYAYTAEIVLNEKTAAEVVRVASDLKVDFLVQSCIHFFNDSLTVPNCIQFLTLSIAYKCEDLRTKCLEFMVRNYAEVAKEEDFTSIPGEELHVILSHPDLYVENEQIIFESMRKWIESDEVNRKSWANKLSEQVRYQLFDIRTLLDMLSESRNQFFQEHIRKAIVDFGTLAEPLARAKWERKLVTKAGNSKAEDQAPICGSNTEASEKPSSPPSTVQTDSSLSLYLVVFGGRSSDKKLRKDIISFEIAEVTSPIEKEPLKNEAASEQESLSTEKNNHSVQYITLDPTPLEGLSSLPSARKGFGAAYVRGQVFLIGGRPKESLNTVDVFDVDRCEWMIGPELKTGRGWHGVAATEDIIFAVGGSSSTDTKLASGEFLDMRTGVWDELPALSKPRMSSGAYASDDNLFIVGGIRENSVDVFDLRAWKWRSLPPLKSHHEAPSVSFYGENLFVFGGAGGSGTLSCTEMYNTSQNTWQAMQHMPQARAFSASATYKHYAVIIGGRNETQGFSDVQVYDMKNNSWSVMDNVLPTERSSCCALII